MEEHKHEWRINWFKNRVFCPYKICQKELTNKEIMRRLNATEQLDAATAIGASVTVSAERHSKALLAYAAALEGE